MRQRDFRDNEEAGDPHYQVILFSISTFHIQIHIKNNEKIRLCQRDFRDNGEAGDPHRFPFPIVVADFVSSNLA